MSAEETKVADEENQDEKKDDKKPPTEEDPLVEPADEGRDFRHSLCGCCSNCAYCLMGFCCFDWALADLATAIDVKKWWETFGLLFALYLVGVFTGIYIFHTIYGGYLLYRTAETITATLKIKYWRGACVPCCQSCPCPCYICNNCCCF
eukprot:UN32401